MHDFKFAQVSNNKSKSVPPAIYEMTDRELLKEQFYLSRFLKTLESNTNMPTLPDPSLLEAIKKENQVL